MGGAGRNADNVPDGRLHVATESSPTERAATEPTPAASGAASTADLERASVVDCRLVDLAQSDARVDA